MQCKLDTRSILSRFSTRIVYWRTLTVMASSNGSNVDRPDVLSAEEIISPSVNGDNSSRGWFSWLPSWKPTSEEQLLKAEQLVLSGLQGDCTNRFVPISPDSYIRTLSIPPQQVATDVPRLPLVMLHGFGCGLGAFYKNLDSLHSQRHLHAFDILGFGRSSRTPFSTDPEVIEDQFVDSIENWRKEMGIEKFILLGHSLGAFMCTLYAMKYPDRVRHLILVDTWGFVEKPDETEVRRAGRYRFILPLIQYYVTLFNPFTIVRALGPYGPRAVSRFRGDLQEKFGDDFMSYVYHCNAQTPPTGESAFSHLQLPIAYAKRPILNRLDSLPASVPISMLYGTRSWFDNSTGEKVYSMRPNSFVDIHYIKGAGHHIHADLPEIFNQVVNDICEMTDHNKDSVREGEPRDEQAAFHSH